LNDDLLALNINNCISIKKCEGVGDGEERLRIGDFMNLPTCKRDSKKWPSTESVRSGFKIGSQVILRRREGSMVKLYVSEILNAKCVAWNRA
jgi:hypothetical protein